MLICVKCAREMRCLKNGVGADFGDGHVYAADKFGCDQCGAEVLSTNQVAHYDPEHKFHDEFLTIKASTKPT